MITENIKEKISKIEELKVVSIDKTRYRFDPKTNTLYIPIFETNFNGMFALCTYLKKINMGVDNRIEEAKAMFADCINLEEIKFTKKLNLKEVNSLYAMFSNCIDLRTLCFSEILTSDKLFDVPSMFKNCFSLKEINFGDNFHSENITNMDQMFYGCESLEAINWREYQPFNHIISIKKTFACCRSLKKLDLRGMNFSSVDMRCLEDTFYKVTTDLKVLVNNTFKQGFV